MSFLLIFFLLSGFPYSTIQSPLQEMPKGIELARCFITLEVER
jgi:hypothetical protein